MILSLVNTKGGVGKTVTAINLGAALAAQGAKTLLVDVDLQGGLSLYFGVDGGPTTADVLTGAAGLDEAAREVRPGLFLVPATADMERAEVELAAASGGEVRLRRAFKRYDTGEFDFVLIDCASGWGAVTRNALLASRAMIVPINSEPAAITGAISTIAAARELGEYHDHDLALLGVLLTRYRPTNAARAMESQSCELWGDQVFDTRIHQAERVNDLAIEGQTFSDVSESVAGPVGADYAALALEVRKRATVLEIGISR